MILIQINHFMCIVVIKYKQLLEMFIIIEFNKILNT